MRQMRNMQEINDRKGFFLVVPMPDGQYSASVESSDRLSPGAADFRASQVRGGDKAIFWHYLDEQAPGLGDAEVVRHFVANCPAQGGVWAVCERFLIENGMAPETPSVHLARPPSRL